jgi:protein-tyrosine phosphatase
MMKILMVCLGNICRSPMAQGVLEMKIAAADLRWEIDSAGTGGWHSGEQPDKRAQQTMASFGKDISAQKARKIRSEDFEYFDRILAADSDVMKDLQDLSPAAHRHKLIYMHPEGKNVPDPYYGNISDFVEVYHLLNEAMDKHLLQMSGR